MHKRKLIQIAFPFLIYAPQSYALKCTQTGTDIINDRILIRDTIAVPNSLPAGTVLWRQPTQRINVQCWVDIQGMPDEKIYFYMNPNNVNLGNEIEIGVTYEGRDYRYSQLPGGKLDIGWSVYGCPKGDTCGWQKESKSMTYSLFFVKKAPAGPNKEGPMTPLADYRAFQFDGVGGVRPGVSYNITALGLNKFRYLPCESSITIQPNVINFGTIGTTSAVNGSVIKEIPFSINEERTCAAVYGLSGYLEPTTATTSSDQTTLIPNDNPSVGISLISQANNKTIPFKKEFELTPKHGATSYRHDFLARLKWTTSRPKAGKFNAGAIVNVFYK
ncbi:fimbrial protein [Pseudomonas sp. CK-NBRI-02]|uniref:fimbrial protein n=1 Tax=Pseudomonas sp. CK-NBRI-02 TaxID=2249759 RepID=UPI000693A2EA|nr:fimbrial protein [Pseudomonas sp. CK-NBRI-02]TYO70649.1 fimbrial protein [Pseudomonas sp. CK-NBRI-02]